MLNKFRNDIKLVVNVIKLWRLIKQLNYKTTMEKLKVYLAKNWKTTLAGAAVGVVGILLQSGVIDPQTAAMVTTILTACGFTAAKDANKTGV